MSDKKRKGAGKIRTEFRKHYGSRPKAADPTREFLAADPADENDGPASERVRAKGDSSRKRTVIGRPSGAPESGAPIVLDVDETQCLPGRVLRVHGLTSIVESERGPVFRCATRRLLKTIATDQRHVVAAGDLVRFRPESGDTGVIERIEPRRGVLCRESRGRQHVLVANVDQVVIVASAAEPALKPHLIDRFLVTAEHDGLRPLICVNKVDLVDPADLQPLVGVYSQLGYPTLLVSATRGWGLDRLRRRLLDKASAIAGQSGVGKSSLLNAIDPQLNLRVQAVSDENQKGKHTTTAAQLVPLTGGGYVVDTPGIRQFQLWDVSPAELAACFPELRPYVSHCRYPDCTHQHEDYCAVKDAVADGRIDLRRYESFCHLFSGE
ncbi:MAG: ribosome small subunit-dependent GTPase A [Planctomycetes bacterium]|nr:ribosome small subunit-dependent GTPase A [Planctomycetota bacterium]